MKVQLIAALGAALLFAGSDVCAAPQHHQHTAQGRPLSSRERARLAQAAHNAHHDDDHDDHGRRLTSRERAQLAAVHRNNDRHDDHDQGRSLSTRERARLAQAARSSRRY